MTMPENPADQAQLAAEWEAQQAADKQADLAADAASDQAELDAQEERSRWEHDQRLR
jgi:hypothetical protein